MEEADPTRVACITGTKGKSTTTALAVHLLTGLGYRRPGGRQHRATAVGSRAAQPEPDYWIVETSSFQVPDLCRAPEVVAVTSLSPDHLDWHGTVERYYADKLSLCTKPGVALALADGSDDLLRAHQAPLGPHLRWVTAADVERDTAWSAALGLPGPHNATQRVHRPRRARRPGHRRRVGRRAPRRGGRGLRRAAEPLPFARRGRSGGVRRRQPLDQRAPGAGRAARLRGPTPSRCSSAVTTAGSTTRRSAAASPPGRAPTLVVTMPDNGPRIGAAVRDAADGRVEVIDAASLDEAVEAAFGWAQPGWRRPALARGPQLRAVRRLPGARRRLRSGRRPVRDAQLNALLSGRPRAPAPRAR